MATITQKNNRRYRIQFTMRSELYAHYQTVLSKASELGVVIDFSSDFEVWFAGQLDQIRHKLKTFELRSVEKGGDYDAD
jgi:hypothetical protein